MNPESPEIPLSQCSPQSSSLNGGGHHKPKPGQTDGPLNEPEPARTQASSLVEKSDSHLQHPPAATSSDGAKVIQEIPTPPRRSDGKIDWEKISDDNLAALLKDFSRSELSASWNISRATLYLEIAKRRANKAEAEFDDNTFGWRPRCYSKPSKLVLLELLWRMPAKHIAIYIGCSQGSILGWTEDYGLKGPGHGYWQRKKNGINVQVPSEIKALYLKLRAEGSPEEQLSEIPDIFQTSDAPHEIQPTVPSDSVQKPCEQTPPASTPLDTSLRGSQTTKSNGRGRRPMVIQLSKAELLEQRWRMSANRLAEKLRICKATLRNKCRELGLGPFLPPKDHWGSRKNGDPIVIPDEIQAAIARFRSEDAKGDNSAGND